jgi:hypothetical protein
MARNENVPEGLPISERDHRRLVPIRSVDVHSVAPPCLNGVQADGTTVGVLENKENEDRGDGDTSIHGGGKNVC